MVVHSITTHYSDICWRKLYIKSWCFIYRIEKKLCSTFFFFVGTLRNVISFFQIIFWRLVSSLKHDLLIINCIISKKYSRKFIQFKLLFRVTCQGSSKQRICLFFFLLVSSTCLEKPWLLNWFIEWSKQYNLYKNQHEIFRCSLVIRDLSIINKG